MKNSLCLAIICCFIIFPAQAQVITTIVGNGTAGFGGDGNAATAATCMINMPHGLDVDTAGNIYISDHTNNRIRKISTSGIITTVAGTGMTTFAGDGGLATAANINQPFDIKTSPNGDIYISDTWNNRIRKVSSTGIISTVAGNGSPGFGGDGGPATAASLHKPCGLDFDAAGNLVFADGENQRVRKINLATGTISTIAGTGTAAYGGDGGPATAANLWIPNYIYIDATNNLYITDNQNRRIRMVNSSGVITTIAGDGVPTFAGDGGPATAASLNYPGGVVKDAAGNLYIADNINNRIRKINTSGIISTYAGTGTASYGGDGGPATSADINNIVDVAIDHYGLLLIADYQNHRIRRVGTPPTGVAVVSPEKISVFPNPNAGAFTINLKDINEPARILVKDVVGRTIKETTTVSGEIVNIKVNVPDGIYFIEVITSWGKWVERVAVEN